MVALKMDECVLTSNNVSTKVRIFVKQITRVQQFTVNILKNVQDKKSFVLQLQRVEKKNANMIQHQCHIYK